MTPTVTETETDSMTAMSEDSVGQRVSSRTSTEAPRPAARPTAPPSKQSMTASMRNCWRDRKEDRDQLVPKLSAVHFSHGHGSFSSSSSFEVVRVYGRKTLGSNTRTKQVGAEIPAAATHPGTACRRPPLFTLELGERPNGIKRHQQVTRCQSSGLSYSLFISPILPSRCPG